MLKSLIVLTILLSSIGSFAQFNETIQTDRPGQAIGAFTAGQGIFQIQSGFDYFGTDDSESNIENEGFISNTVLRYGLTETFEVSAMVDYKTETFSDSNTKEKKQGFSAFDIGMRYHIYTGKGLIPSVGFQLRFSLPVLGDDYEIKDLAPRFLFVTSQNLSETFTLTTNWGASWNGNNSVPTGVYVINLSFPFNAKLGGFIENYGSLSQGTFATNVDAGLALLITNDLQLDLSAGYGNNDGVKNYFVSTGFSWRTKRKN